MPPIATLLAVQSTTTSAPDWVPDLLREFWPTLLTAAWFLGGFLVVLVLGWYVVQPAIDRGIRRRNRNNPTLREAIARYVRLVVLVVALYVGAGVAGFGQFLTNSSLIIAAGTLAVGVAGQTVIGSLVSGMVLVADPEFNVGNYIEWPDGEGEVKSITLRVTRIHTPDGELVTIPNETLTSEAVTRPYGRGQYRIVEHVGLAYDDDVEEAIDHLEAAATGIDGVLEEPLPSAYVDEFGSDAVIVRVHYWIEDPRRRDIFGVRSAYAKAVKHRLERSGITISPASKRDLNGRIEVADSA